MENINGLVLLLLAAIGVIVTIATFVFPNPEKYGALRIALGIVFLIGTIGLTVVGVVILTVPIVFPQLTSLPTAIPTSVASPPMENPVPEPNSAAMGVTPTPTRPTIGAVETDPRCQSGISGISVREVSNIGDEKTYVRCPEGNVQYLIQTDDLLTNVRLECLLQEPIAVGFSRNAQFSQNEQLPTYETDPMFVRRGCVVIITVANTDGDQIGYTIRQEVVDSRINPASVAEATAMLEVTPSIQDPTIELIKDIPSTPEEAARRWGGSPDWWQQVLPLAWKVIGQLKIDVDEDWRIDFIAPDGTIASCDHTGNPGIYGPATVSVSTATLWYAPGETRCPPSTIWGKANQ